MEERSLEPNYHGIETLARSEGCFLDCFIGKEQPLPLEGVFLP